MMLRRLLPAVLLFALAATLGTPAFADEASVRKGMEAKLGTRIDSVTKTPYPGIYEVYSDGQIVYTDEKLTTIFLGPLIDGKTMKNVTAERMQKLTAIRFSDLPLEQAVKIVRGDGKRVFATFEDPNCGYCKRLAKEIGRLENVTMYVFLFPILSPDSLDKSKQIWCSADRSRTWSEWMVDGKSPTGKGDCDTSAVQKNLDLGRKLGINGTPTIFFADGERIPGAVPLSRIEQKLAQTPTR